MDGPRPGRWQRWRGPARVALAVFFVSTGLLHFARPEFYLKIMPPYLPWHLALVYVSGVFEVLGGVGILVPSLRRAAGWGLIALLVAVFPANIQLAVDSLRGEPGSYNVAVALGRLPLQVPLILWVWWVMHDEKT